MKIRSQNDLQDKLDAERAWRVKEISDVKSLVKQSNSVRQGTYLRAGLPLLYAHWEGFIKKSAVAYASYVSSRRLSINELSDNFVAITAKRAIQNANQSSKIDPSIAVVQLLRQGGNSRSNTKFENSINSKSNLNSEVFCDIATTIGVSIKRYEQRFNFIDIELLGRRNSIAHGDSSGIDSSAFSNLCDEVIVLFNWFRNDIENLVALESYKANPQL